GSTGDDDVARSMAQRVLGVVEVQRGEVEAGLARCRHAIETAREAHRRALAVAYLGLALLEAGRHEEAVRVGLDGAADAQRQGFETSFGAFLHGIAAHALVRLGRWPEAD